MGVLPLPRGRPGAGMEWRVTIELNGADGAKQTHEVARGGRTDPHSPLDPLGVKARKTPPGGGPSYFPAQKWQVS